MTESLRNVAAERFPTLPVGPLGIIAMRGCEEMGQRVNEYLTRWQQSDEDNELLRSYAGAGNNGFLIESSCPRFGTGEGKGMITSTVRGYDLYILVDVGAYNCTYKMYGKDVPMSPDEHFSDLKRIIAAAGGKGKRINVIMPMLYEARQHRRTSRESLDCALMLQELTNMGVSNIITFDAHDPRVQNAIPLAGFESVMPSYQMLKALLRSEKDLQMDKDHMIVISPDEGAINRNIYYASALGLNLGMFYKRRDYTRVVDGRNPIIAHEYLGEDVEGKDVIVVDDIISSGESMLELAYELKKRRARRIYAACTYAFFTSGLEEFDKAYNDGIITKVIATNLTYRTPELLARPWFIDADMSKYMAYIVATLNHDRSLSSLLNPWDRIKALLDRYHTEQAQNGIRFI